MTEFIELIAFSTSTEGKCVGFLLFNISVHVFLIKITSNDINREDRVKNPLVLNI